MQRCCCRTEFSRSDFLKRLNTSRLRIRASASILTFVSIAAKRGQFIPPKTAKNRDLLHRETRRVHFELLCAPPNFSFAPITQLTIFPQEVKLIPPQLIRSLRAGPAAELSSRKLPASSAEVESWKAPAYLSSSSSSSYPSHSLDQFPIQNRSVRST